MYVNGRAAVLREFKQPLMVEEMSFRDPKRHEVLVRVTACGVCHADVHAVDGDWPIKPPLPLVPGHEGVGIVVKAGHSVREVHEGDRVGLPWLRSACGECEWCLTGWETLCPYAFYGGYSANGSFADFVLADGAYAAIIPPRLSDLQAAPILCAGVTSWKALKETEAKPGEWVAISGIGGLGQLAIQYALAMGLHVVAVDPDPEKLLRAKDMGAELTLNPLHHDVPQMVQKEIEGAHGVVVTADSPGAFHQAIAMTRRKGTCVLVGLPPGEFSIPVFDVVLKRLTIRGSFVGTREDLSEALSLAADKGFQSEVSEKPLEEVNAGLSQLREGKVKGRIVLTF